MHRLLITGALFIHVVLGGCAITDSYSPRAIAYNLEAEQAQNQALLLNIVRSYLHRPMQFTAIQSILGINGGTAGLNIDVPIGRNSSTGLTVGGATGSLTTSTNFTIPVLDTQEFYQGILTPIPPMLVDYYLHAAYPKDLMFNLIFEKIGVKVIDSRCRPSSHLLTCERTFRNNPQQPENIALFQVLASYLLDLQLSTEPIKPGTASLTSGSDAKLQSPYRICFSPRTRASNELVDPGALCGATQSATTNKVGDATMLQPIKFSRDLAANMLTVVDRLGDQARYAESIRHFEGREVSITLTTRSTAGIFRYLGQLIRADQDGVSITLFPPTLERRSIPCWIEPAGETGCKPIFTVKSIAMGEAALTAISYAGAIYSVPASPDASLAPDVLSFLKELLAMMTSAKTLPASSILSISPPR
jgi:hypothetical protein